MGKEFELKYAVSSAEVLAEIEKFLQGEALVQEMSAVYYDTADSALSSRKWTLRLRKENGDSVVTFKTAGDGKTRGEWEYAADSIDFAAETLADLGAPQELTEILAQGVLPICGAEFVRRAIVKEQNGTVLEVALDYGRLFRGNREMPICELEVELKQGEETVAVAFALQLAERFGLQEESRSKFVRAVNL